MFASYWFELCTWLIVFLLLVCLVWVESGDGFANEEPIEFAYEDPVNSNNFAGKMITPSRSRLFKLTGKVKGIKWVRGLTWQFGRHDKQVVGIVA